MIFLGQQYKEIEELKPFPTSGNGFNSLIVSTIEILFLI